MELRKRRAITAVVLVTLVFSSWLIIALINRYTLGMDAFKENAYQAYQNFDEEMNHLQEDLQLLEDKDPKAVVPRSGDYVSWYVLHSLHSNQYNLEKMDKRYTMGHITFFYQDITPRLNRLMADGQISEAEHRFIKDLRAFTKDVQKIHKQYADSVNYHKEEDYFKKEKMFSKEISRVYYGFFFETDLLYQSEPYEFMRTFEGDYSSFDSDSAVKTCLAIYDQLIGGEPLTYNNKNEIYKRDLIFKTTPLTEDQMNLSDLTRTEPIYDLTLHKDDLRLEIQLSSGYEEKGTLDTTPMNQRAEVLAKIIFKDAKRLSVDYNTSYDKKTVTTGYYYYRVNPKGKTDDERNMTLQLLPDGKIVHISLPNVSGLK